MRYERLITVDDRYVFAIASSGVIAEKSGAAREKYNRLSLLVKVIVDAWQYETNGRESTLAAILSSEGDAAKRLRRVLQSANKEIYSNQQLLDRFEHFEIEDQLIKSLPATLEPETIAVFGELVGRSQQAAERLLANQTPEITHLVESAVQLGAHAASAFGAGFGGSVWALIEAANEADFLIHWQNNYSNRFPQSMPGAAFFVTRPGPPARIWSDGQSLIAG